MRGDEEAREVEVLGREAEQTPDLGPVVERRGGWGGGLERGEEPSGNEDRAGGGSLDGEERTAGRVISASGARESAQHTLPSAHCLTCPEVG